MQAQLLLLAKEFDRDRRHTGVIGLARIDTQIQLLHDRPDVSNQAEWIVTVIFGRSLFSGLASRQERQHG